MSHVNAVGSAASDLWLSRFAKAVVFGVFLLILVGGHTTTMGAGMAFPDWPLSAGSLNPEGWWRNMMTGLEHSHRLIAETVGLLIGILCAWVWQKKWALPCAAIASVLLAISAWLFGAPSYVVAHVGLWSAAVIFAVLILTNRSGADFKHPPIVRWLAFAAFVGVCLQAVMGGLRVTIDTAGDATFATAFRIAHGGFAQIELCLLVMVAALLSPVMRQVQGRAGNSGVETLAWVCAAVLLLQLGLGAAMRHLGAGLAIPTFPAATAEGGLWPSPAAGYALLNFSHTRIGALLVSILLIFLVVRTCARCSTEVRLFRPALLIAFLLVVQVLLGLLVVWKMRPPVLTTLHVVNGAALLATTVLLAVRARPRSAGVKRVRFEPAEPLELAHI